MKKKLKIKQHKNYENLSLLLNDKSDYLKNLEKKRNDGLKAIKEQKAKILIEDIFKLNKFRRDYSCFSFNSRTDDNNNPLNKNISQILKYPVKSKIINNYSNKKVNSVQFGLPVINNYFQIQKKNNYSIKYNTKKKSRYKILENSGQNIIMKNHINNNYIKSKFIKNSNIHMNLF